MTGEYLTIKEIARHFKISTRTVVRWMKKGMPSIKKEGARRFKLEECIEWFENK